MTLALFAAFWAVSILLVITPGMDWAYVISAGIRGRVVVPAVADIIVSRSRQGNVSRARIGQKSFIFHFEGRFLRRRRRALSIKRGQS